MSTVIAAPVERVWAAVRDFNGLPGWLPGIVASEIEDGGPADEVGAVRLMTVKGGAQVRERLVSLDDAGRCLSYSILSGPLPVVDYLATMRVAPITDAGSTFAEWSARFDVPEGVEPDQAREFVTGVFGRGWHGLKKRLAGSDSG